MTPENKSNDQTERICLLKGGPSKFDLMFALFDDRHPNSSEPYGRALIFHTLEKLPAKTADYSTYREYKEGKIAFYLFKIERDKDNPEWWTLWGIWVDNQNKIRERISVRIVYQTDKRTGAIFKE